VTGVQTCALPISTWTGVLLLGIAGVIALVTTLLVLVDRDLTILSNAGKQNSGGAESVGLEAAATATAATAATPAPTPTAIPSDLEITADSAYVVDAARGIELFNHEPDVARQPASTAKIITAVTVVEHSSPEEVITITQQDVVNPVE